MQASYLGKEIGGVTCISYLNMEKTRAFKRVRSRVH